MPEKRAKRNAKTAAKGKNRGQPMKTLPEYWPPFPFLDLPQEIRDMIYNLVLVAPRPVGCACCRCLDCCETRSTVSVSRVSRKGFTLQHYEPALIRTCRQLRKEGRGLFYSQNSFHMYIENFNFVPLYGWLKLIGPELSMALKILDLEIGGSTGWVNARQYLEAKETQLSPEINIVISGRLGMSTAFNAACDIGADLRKVGNSWNQIEKTLDKSQYLVEISDFNMDWPYEYGESDDDDMIINGQASHSVQILRTPW